MPCSLARALKPSVFCQALVFVKSRQQHQSPVADCKLWDVSHFYIMIRTGESKQKPNRAKDVSAADLPVGHCIASQQYVPVYSSWLLATNCEMSLADKPPPQFCTLPSGWQFTACNLVEKMWSLLVFVTDRLCFVWICRASWMLGAGKEGKK